MRLTNQIWYLRRKVEQQQINKYKHKLNLSLIWHLPNIKCFLCLISVSVASGVSSINLYEHPNDMISNNSNRIRWNLLHWDIIGV